MKALHALLAVLLIAAVPACQKAQAQVKPRTQHQKLNLILEKLDLLIAGKPTVVVPPAPVTPITPRPPPSTSTIDYSPYVGMTPQEIMGSFGPFQGRGLPGGWNWNEAFAAGVLNPDANRPPPDPANLQGSTGYDPSGSVLPWNPPGSGRYLRAAGQSFVFYIDTPAGFVGSREVAMAAVPSPFQTQFNTATVTFEGTVISSGGQGAMARTGTMTGGRRYSIGVTLDQPGAFSIQLVQ